MGQSKPTIGADFSKKEILIDNTVVTLQVWDTAGQEKFQSLGYAFYRGADCCALVYDLTNLDSFHSLDKWKQGFIENAGPSDPANFPFVCLGNKLDKQDNRQVPASKGQAWAKDNNDMMFYETSALTGDKVEEAFLQMAKAALKREGEKNIVMPPTMNAAENSQPLKLNSKDHKKRGETTTQSNCSSC